jgi:5-methylthioadenosine/S-adenosylhomocysteine deaminase
MKKKIIIRNGIVLSMVEGQPAQVADVIVEEDRFSEIRKLDPGEEDDVGADVLDAGGCVVMPGFINTHTHTPMTIMRSTMDGLGFPSLDSPQIFPAGMDWRGGLTADDHALSTRLAQLEMIRTGTTTFVDMYHDMDRVAEAVIESGMRAALGSEIHDFRNDPDEWLPYDEEVARNSFEASVQFASDWNGCGDGRVMTLIAPHETSTCREPWLSKAAQLAGELGLGISIHVAESPYEFEYCKEHYGLTPVEVMQEAGILEHRVIGAHSVLLTDGDISILAGADYTAASCLQSYLKLATDITPVPKLKEAGVRIGLGTDSTLTNNNLNLWDELYITACLHGFLGKDPALISPEDVLRMVTVSGAEAIGLREELGTIEVGKRADLIIVELSSPNLHPYEGVLVNNLVYAANGNEVRDVMVDGTFLMRDREILTIDEARILSEVRQRVRELRKQGGLPERFERP